MALRLIKIGSSGFNLDAVAGWRYQTHPQFPNDCALYLYLSGMSELLFFEQPEADVVERLLTASSQKIAVPSVEDKKN